MNARRRALELISFAVFFAFDCRRRAQQLFTPKVLHPRDDPSSRRDAARLRTITAVGSPALECPGRRHEPVLILHGTGGSGSEGPHAGFRGVPVRSGASDAPRTSRDPRTASSTGGDNPRRPAHPSRSLSTRLPWRSKPLYRSLVRVNHLRSSSLPHGLHASLIWA